MERLTLPPGGAAAVDEYLEYRRIVGEDDGGKLFTPEEYEEYKRKVLPLRLQNRLFVSWRSPTGMDCKLVGPETLCFCTHRVLLCHSGWSAVARSWLIAASTSWAQVILRPQPPK
ncbi:FAM221A isoform 5 [Pan troglodytes]|uniref:Protein FAM221A n=2 Tax=Pan troglodytes TaxID=9598 RepID=A0A2I3SSX1_PANTR|nr:FAM221A isoform 5 [Pan troglodytes]